MNCIECGEPSPTETCAVCIAEERMYAAYRNTIDVPPLWSGIEERIRPEMGTRKHSTFNIQHSTFNIAAAAILAVLMIAATLFLLRAPRKAPPVATIATEHYRVAIANLEPRNSDPLLPPLTNAIGAAERAAQRAPNDPVEVTRLVAAYDAKLQLLRATVDD